ncbi:unnamed protein product [Pelagomonas calceolata]|uniref:Uncharacterized protein n=1 Tax=Pelagomonas calceolata TaxID=35677 RepID=A0A8J2SUA8_9STRA|nr:unnamed protein product [Pelagomonas calceolata]
MASVATMGMTWPMAVLSEASTSQGNLNAWPYSPSVYVSQALIFSFSPVGLPASGATGARGLCGHRIVWSHRRDSVPASARWRTGDLSWLISRTAHRHCLRRLQSSGGG